MTVFWYVYHGSHTSSQCPQHSRDYKDLLIFPTIPWCVLSNKDHCSGSRKDYCAKMCLFCGGKRWASEALHPACYSSNNTLGGSPRSCCREAACGALPPLTLPGLFSCRCLSLTAAGTASQAPGRASSRESPPAALSAWTAPTGNTVMKQVIPTELLWDPASPLGVTCSCAEIASLQCWTGGCFARGLPWKSGRASSEKLMGFESCGPQVLSSARPACPLCSELGRVGQRTWKRTCI